MPGITALKICVTDEQKRYKLDAMHSFMIF